tara:strand:- start:4322 stop:4708 length:387 start_codon:yes stop_codon:yes gene_type:complete
MTTTTRKKSIYDSDDTPSRSDKQKAKELYYQDGKPSAILLAEDMAMLRRNTVANASGLDKMNKKLDNLTIINAASDRSIKEQSAAQQNMTLKQGEISDTVNQIRGMGKLLIYIVPVMLTVIGIIVAFK